MKNLWVMTRLYNLVNDPTESSNQYAARPDVVAEMQATFTNFLQTTNAPVDNTPPVAPVAGTATPGNRSIALDWPDNTDTDISHYLVYRSATASGHHTPIALTQTSAYTDSAVILNATNYYTVVAVDQRGNQSLPGSVMQAVPQNNLAALEQKLVEFDFTIVSNQPSVLNGILTSPGLSVVRGLARNGLGLSTTALASNEWNLTTTIDNATLNQVLNSTNKLYQDFALGTKVGHSVRITRVRFDFFRNGTQSPTNYYLFVDEAGYATNTAIGALQVTGTAQTAFSVSNLWLSLDQLTEFRLYMVSGRKRLVS